MKNGMLIAIFCGLLGAIAVQGQELDKVFQTPPDSAKPWIMWFWISDFVTKEAITYDLEAYQRVGVGGVLLFPNYEHVEGWGFKFAPTSRGKDRPQPLSDAWYDCVRHAIQECDRLGMKIAFHNEPGYSGAGGPWVTAEHSMRRLVESSTDLQGPGPLPDVLPAAEGLDYRDAAVLAYPLPELTDDPQQNPKPTVAASSFHPRYPLTNALDWNDETFWVSNGEEPGQAPTPTKPEWISFQYDEPFTAASALIAPRSMYGPRDCQIQASKDGKQWTTLKEATLADDPVQVEFEPTAGRFFRLLITTSHSRENTQIIRIALLQPGQKAWAGLASRDILDLTERLGANGRLDWEAPEGRWRIIRYGHVSTGKKIHPASPIAEGYECDKMSVEAVTHHFENGMIGRVLALEPQLNGKTVVGVELDSYEGGDQDWSPKFRQQFRQRRGYDPLPWLPAWRGGAIIDNPAMVQRFRNDMRQTIAEVHADVYYDLAAAFCRARGVQLYTEAYGTPLWDTLTNAGRADVPTAEYWLRGGCQGTVRLMASAAHTLNKPLVTAEAFTYSTERDPWWIDPYAMKARGDLSCCMGLNHNILTESALQVWQDQVKPGMTFDAWGTPFNPNQTWWEPGRAWMAYQARCHGLLQQGHFVADILTLAPFVPGEGVWSPPGGIDPVHREYNYDLCAEEVLVRHARCQDGSVVLPGMEYRILTLVQCDKLRPRTIERIAELVEQGATVIGAKSSGTPGLEGFPESDDRVRELADRVWGEVDGKEVTENRFGKGRVVCGLHPHEVLMGMGVLPDVDVDDRNIHWIHRQCDEGEIYFLSNQGDEDVAVEATFRVSGKSPELWDPATGEMRHLPEFRRSEQSTTVSLWFVPHQSYFVIFRDKPAKTDGKNFAELQLIHRLAGPWHVAFDPEWGGPAEITFEELEDWTVRPEDGIKHYSGTATYRKVFDMVASVSTGAECFLDLGTLKNLAEVSLNGQPLGVVWCPPWRVRIPVGVLQEKNNRLQIQVTNTWVNRLIGDARQPDDAEWSEMLSSAPFVNKRTRSLLAEPQWLADGTPRPSQGRYAFATYKHLYADDELQPSGLLGPVTLLAAEAGE